MTLLTEAKFEEALQEVWEHGTPIRHVWIGGEPFLILTPEEHFLEDLCQPTGLSMLFNLPHRGKPLA